jgi:hypothetical protein
MKLPETAILESSLPKAEGGGSRKSFLVSSSKKDLCIIAKAEGYRHSFHFVASSVPSILENSSSPGIPEAVRVLIIAAFFSSPPIHIVAPGIFFDGDR